MFNARVSDVTEVDVFSSSGITDETHKTRILSDYLTSNGEDLDFDDSGNIVKGTEIFKSVDVVTTELSDFINKYDKTKLQGSTNVNNKSDDNTDDEVSVVGYMRDLFEISITDEEGNEIAFEDAKLQFEREKLEVDVNNNRYTADRYYDSVVDGKLVDIQKEIIKAENNIGETYTDTYSGTGNRLGLIFTATSSFLPGDIITIDKNNKQSNHNMTVLVLFMLYITCIHCSYLKPINNSYHLLLMMVVGLS